MKRKILFSSLLVGLTIFNGSSNANDGDKAPYNSFEATHGAVEFAKGVISTIEHFEINAVFNKAGNKVLFARCTDDFKTCTMMESDYINGNWHEPKKLWFSGGFLEADPYYSPDERFIYFVSKRPYNSQDKEASSVNLWRSERVNGQWLAPEYLPALSSDANDLYPSITSNGDLYFPSFRNNQRLMYVAKLTENGFDKPTPLPSEMFGKDGLIGDSVMLENGKAIIFSMRRGDSLGKGDLYISHLVNNQWTTAKSLGEKVNTSNHEFTPIVSPDGQYLFFTRVENGRGNIYQIALDAVL